MSLLSTVNLPAASLSLSVRLRPDMEPLEMVLTGEPELTMWTTGGAP